MKADDNQSNMLFPWRRGQHFRLLIEGKNFFPDMLRAIDAAESHILMEMYIAESGRVVNQFINAMLRAVARGVSVQLLFDDYGSRGLHDKERKRIRDGGITLVFYNPLRFYPFGKNLLNNFFRTHRKFMVIDGKTAYVGGTGLTDKFIGATAWRDCMLRVDGSTAIDWQTLFQRNMERWSEPAQAPPVRVIEHRDGAPGRLVFSNGGTRLQLKKNLLNRIRHGEQRIWLASAYFIPSGKIRRALRRAAINGKDVRLLLPGSVTDHPAVRYASRRYYTRLLRHGVRIYEYKQRFMHAKIVLIDNWCTVGSSNFDRWNFRWNLEANQEIESANLAVAVHSMLEKDFMYSEEIHYRLWSQRSRLLRLKEWVWGKIDRWLTSRLNCR